MFESLHEDKILFAAIKQQKLQPPLCVWINERFLEQFFPWKLGSISCWPNFELFDEDYRDVLLMWKTFLMVNPICAIRLRRKRLWNLELWFFSPELYWKFKTIFLRAVRYIVSWRSSRPEASPPTFFALPSFFWVDRTQVEMNCQAFLINLSYFLINFTWSILH